MRKNKQRKFKFQSKKVNHSFTGTMLTQYGGLSSIMKYLNKIHFGQKLNEIFPTEIYNATKFSNVQVLLSVILSSFAGINRLKRITQFTSDPLVIALLGLEKKFNKDIISVRLKELGRRGAHRLEEFRLSLSRQWLTDSALTHITLDADSTVTTVYGNQEGAAKGFNSHKKGAKSYHPLLVFASELKLIANTWFRTGSAYTSNGICEFLRQTNAMLPTDIEKVFFRADSGFFSGRLFDLLEEFEWTYLIKVKMKNLKKLLENQAWSILLENNDIAICEFYYQANGWKKPRKLRAIRTLERYEWTEYFGERIPVPIYKYACYCSNLPLNAYELHQNYKERSESETWIEQAKSQLLAAKTLTNDFHANDILWQLNILAYNLSLMMRYRVKKVFKQEHATFRNWFINVPAKLVRRSRQLELKIYECYYFREQWVRFDDHLSQIY
jgi:hypothetical protein